MIARRPPPPNWRRHQVAVRVRTLSPDGQAPAARDVLASVLRYILDTAGVKPATLRELLARQVDREEAERMLSTAEMLRREGEVDGKRKTLLLQLRLRFGRLPAAATSRIDTAGAAKLDVWLGRIAAPPSKATRPARAQPRGARSRARS